MSKNLAKSSLALIAFTLISKVLVIVRDMAMAAVFGASSRSDAYITATTILSLIITVALSALAVAFIPIASGKSDDELNRITNNFMTVLSVLTLVLSILALFFTKEIVLLFASGFSEETVQQTQLVLRIVLPLLFFNVMLNVAVAYLQYKGSFWYQGLSGVIGNCIIIAAVLLCQRSLSVMAVGFLLSIMVPAIIGLMIANKSGLRVKPDFSFKNKYVRELLVLAVPVFASQILVQFNTIIDKNFASQLGIGIVTNLDYAHKTSIILIAAFVPSIATVLYPTMAQQAANGEHAVFSVTMERGLKIATLISFPIMVGIMLLAQPVINLLLLRGNYSVQAATVTAQALFYYGFGMLPSGWIYVLNNGFYATKDARTPLLSSSAAVVLNIVLNFVLVRFYGYCGLAAATSISVVLNAALCFIWMKKRIGCGWVKGFCKSLLKITIAICGMAAIVYVGKQLLSGWFARGGGWELLSCTLLTAGGAAVYLAVCLLLKEDITTEYFLILRNRLRRKKQ